MVVLFSQCGVEQQRVITSYIEYRNIFLNIFPVIFARRPLTRALTKKPFMPKRAVL